MIRVITVVLLHLVVLQVCAVSQQSKTDFEIESEATVFQSETGQFSIRTDIGTIPSGKRGIVHLLVHNPYDLPITIDKFKTSCSCLKAGTSSGEIPARGSSEIDLILQVPPESKDPQYKMHLMLISTANGEIPIELRSFLGGLSCFTGATYLTELSRSQSKHTFRIPIVVTDPVKTNSLKVTCSDSMRNFRCRAVSDGSEDFVECTFSGTPESVLGEVTLTNDINGKKSKLTCIVRSRPFFEIAPQVLRFVQDEADVQKYSESVLVKLDPETLGDTNSEIEPLPVIEWDSREGRLTAELVRIARGIYKARLTLIPEPNRKDRDDKVIVEYKHKGGTATKELKSFLKSK
jgi:hypothetical protein